MANRSPSGPPPWSCPSRASVPAFSAGWPYVRRKQGKRKKSQLRAREKSPSLPPRPSPQPATTNVPVHHRNLMPLIQLLQHRTIPRQHCQHLRCDPAVDGSHRSLLCCFDDPLDPEVDSLTFVEREGEEVDSSSLLGGTDFGERSGFEDGGFEDWDGRGTGHTRAGDEGGAKNEKERQEERKG